jgi:hypothetical protein
MSSEGGKLFVTASFCPALSFTTKQASNSSTDQGGGSGGRASVVNEFVAGPRDPADAEKSFHLTDRFGDHAVRRAGRKLML